MQSKKFNFLFLLVFIVIFSNFISAQTLTNANITATGINATINISNYIITFDRLDVFDNAITFYNLSYTNPASCNSTSSFYDVYNYTTPNSISDLPSVACTATTTTTSSSGGGGGIVTTNTANITTQITNYISITANQSKEINITNSQIDLTKIIITTNQNISNVLLIITEKGTLPENTTNNLPFGISYQSFEINFTNSDKVTNAIINFKVNKTFLQIKNASSSDVVLYRLKNNSWNPLSTTFLNEDEKYYYFNAISPGFSTFTIFLNQKLCVANAKRCFDNQTQICSENSTWIILEQCQNGCENGNCIILKKSPLGFTIIVAAIIGLILIVIYSLFNKIKRGVYKPYSKF